MINVIVVLLYLGLPAIALYLCHKYQFLNKVGAVVLSYLFGLILGFLGLSGDRFHFLQEVLMAVTVPLAIPLLLFSSNIKEWKKLAVQPFYSLVFALLAVIIAVVLGYKLFHGNEIEQFNKVGGLLVGIYCGGTPNLATLKMILDVDETIYLAVHSYDMAVGAVYLFFLMGIGKKLFQLVLPKFNAVNGTVTTTIEIEKSVTKSTRYKLLVVFLITLIMVVLAGGIMLIMPGSAQVVIFIFLITAMGIGGSSIKMINSVKGTFDLGMYLILIFSIVVASKLKVDSLSDVNPSIFAYITFVVFVSLILHVLFARIRKIDTDTVIVTSVALICSPPFVPVVAGAIHNRSLIAPGLMVGLIGYALGNYFGYLIAVLLAYL